MEQQRNQVIFPPPVSYRREGEGDIWKKLLQRFLSHTSAVVTSTPLFHYQLGSSNITFGRHCCRVFVSHVVSGLTGAIKSLPQVRRRQNLFSPFSKYLVIFFSCPGSSMYENQGNTNTDKYAEKSGDLSTTCFRLEKRRTFGRNCCCRGFFSHQCYGHKYTPIPLSARL